MQNGYYREQTGIMQQNGVDTLQFGCRQPGNVCYSGHDTYKMGSASANQTCVLEFDGSSRGVPRYGGAGCILLNEANEIVYELRVGLGEVSNNVAEYLALIYGMRTALHLGMSRLEAWGDPALVVSQVGGDMAVGSELSVYHREVTMLASLFAVFEICEVSRKMVGLTRQQQKALNILCIPLRANFHDEQAQEEYKETAMVQSRQIRGCMRNFQASSAR